jgi:putative endonuclease
MTGLVETIRGWWRERFSRERSLGERGEDAAARYLKRLRYTVLARGDRSTLGEIDLVAEDHGTVVFVEVKTRASDDDGLPSEAVDVAKQRRLTRLALSFLKRHGLLENAARFDVIAITWPARGRRPQIEHIKNAFESSGWQGFFS